MCGGSPQSSINDAQTGQPMKGVGAKEYVQNVLYPLLDRLFSKDRLYSDSLLRAERRCCTRQQRDQDHPECRLQRQMDH